MTRLHIVGCPRSGTTLLMELVSTCFGNSGFCAHELSIFEPLHDPGPLYFSKQPNDIKQIGHIFHRDPNLNIIYLGRDPRAVITSKHRANPDEYFCNYRVWSECDKAAQRYWTHPRFMPLRYEDLVRAPDDVQRRIAECFDFMHPRHPFTEYHLHAEPSGDASRAMNGLREIDLDSLDKWRGHLPRVAEQLKRRPGLADDLVRLGYEPDNRWLELLEGVTPVVYPCRYPERRPYLKEWEKSLRVYLKSRRYLQRLTH